MEYYFHPEALEDYQAAADWYRARSKSLALRFVGAIEDAILKITESPERWRVVDDDVRRCLTSVFPYGVLFTLESEFVLIVAVMHLSREPGYWKHRLNQELSER